MTVVAGDFLVRFPVFNGVPADQVEAQLADANDTFEPTSFFNEKSYRRAVMLLTAHSLVLSGAGAGVEAELIERGFSMDAIQSVSDGGVSVSLRDRGGAASVYGATSYGLELARLLRSATVGATVAGGRLRANAAPAGQPAPLLADIPVSGSPDNIIERHHDGLFAAPRLASDDW